MLAAERLRRARRNIENEAVSTSRQIECLIKACNNRILLHADERERAFRADAPADRCHASLRREAPRENPPVDRAWRAGGKPGLIELTDDDRAVIFE